MVFDGVETTSLILVAILIAIVAFFYSNLGLGGGQLYVPIMDLFWGGNAALAVVSLEMRDIVPLSLTFAFVTMLSSTYTHGKKHFGLQLAAAGLIGVAGGVLFTSTVDERIVKAGFATLLVIVATKMIFDIYKAKKDNTTSPTHFSARRRLAGMGISILTGFLVGSFGIGGGVVSVPLIIYVFRFEPRKAIGTSALLGCVLTPAAVLAYVLTAEEGVVFHYQLALVLAPIVFIMAIIGSTWGLQKLRTPVVKTIFTGGVYLAASEMIYSLLFR